MTLAADLFRVGRIELVLQLQELPVRLQSRQNVQDGVDDGLFRFRKLAQVEAVVAEQRPEIKIIAADVTLLPTFKCRAYILPAGAPSAVDTVTG